MFNIVRYHFKGEKKNIKENVTLEEAQRHCNDPETSSKTCKHKENRDYTKQHGPWFDGYEFV
jgi:hypothetical protein